MEEEDLAAVRHYGGDVGVQLGREGGLGRGGRSLEIGTFFRAFRFICTSDSFIARPFPAGLGIARPSARHITRS